jgi:hypothetical protein
LIFTKLANKYLWHHGFCVKKYLPSLFIYFLILKIKKLSKGGSLSARRSDGWCCLYTGGGEIG